MKPVNVLNITNRKEFREWLEINHSFENECWLNLKRGRPVDDEHFWYLDAVEEALCYGWIDSTWKLIDGVRMQRFSLRKKNSPWSELNKERVRRLEKLGMMKESGRAVLPDMNLIYTDKEIMAELEKEGVIENFRKFPELYQRIRLYNVAFYRKKDRIQYEKSLTNLIEKTRKSEMYGEWNDYGRLIDY